MSIQTARGEHRAESILRVANACNSHQVFYNISVRFQHVPRFSVMCVPHACHVATREDDLHTHPRVRDPSCWAWAAVR